MGPILLILPAFQWEKRAEGLLDFGGNLFRIAQQHSLTPPPPHFDAHPLVRVADFLGTEPEPPEVGSGPSVRWYIEIRGGSGLQKIGEESLLQMRFKQGTGGMLEREKRQEKKNSVCDLWLIDVGNKLYFRDRDDESVLAWF